MFEDEVKGMSKNEAIKKQFNITENEKDNTKGHPEPKGESGNKENGTKEKNNTETPKQPRSTKAERLRNEEEDAWEKYRNAKKSQANSGIPFNLMPEYIDAVKASIKRYINDGVEVFEDFLNRFKSEIGEEHNEDQLRDLWDEENENKDLEISAKNKAIEQSRLDLEKDPIIKELASTQDEIVSKAAEIMSEKGAVNDMVESAITNKNFKFDASEQLAILKSRSDISEEYYDTLRKLDKDPNNKELQRKRDALSFKLDTHDQVLTNIGTIAGQVLWARRMFLDRELTKAKVLDKMRNDGEGYIPSDVKKKMDDLFDEKDKLSATIDGLEKKLKEANEALEKEKALNESLGKNAISVQGEPRQLGGRKSAKQSIKDKLKKYTTPHAKDRPELVSTEDEVKYVARDIVAEALENGESLTPEEWVKRTHKEIEPLYEDVGGITEREVQEIISEYGEKERKVANPLTTEINRLKTLGKIKAAMLDVMDRMLPRKSGYPRKEIAPAVRALRLELSKMIQDYGLDTQEANPQKWLSAVEKLKKNLQKQIDDLTETIKTGVLPERRSKMELPFDIDVERLKFQRDKLQEQVDLLDASKARKSEEQLKARKRATKNAIDKYQEALDNEQKLKQKGKSNVTDEDLQKEQKKLKDLKKEYDDWYKDKYEDEIDAKKLNQALKRLNGDEISGKIGELEKKRQAIEKAKNGDFSEVMPKSKTKKDYSKRTNDIKKLADELDAKRLERDGLNKQIRQQQIRFEGQNKSWRRRAADFILGVMREFSISAGSGFLKIGNTGLMETALSPIYNALGHHSFMKYITPSSLWEGLPHEKDTNPLTDYRVGFGQYAKKRTYKDAWDKFTKQHHESDLKYGDDRAQTDLKIGKVPLNWFGRGHGLVKTIAGYSAARAKAEYYLTKDALKDKNNLDSSGNLTQAAKDRIGAEAHEAGMWASLLSPNKLAQKIRRISGELKKGNRWQAFQGYAIDFHTQVMTVAQNFYGKQMAMTPLLGHIRAALPLMHKWSGTMFEEVQKLDAKDRKFIIRNLKMGNTGVALVAIGVLCPNLYDDKGNMVVGGHKLPRWAEHIPIFFPIKLGNLLRKFYESEDKDGGKLTMDIIKEFVSHNPFAFQLEAFARAAQNEHFLKELAYQETAGRTAPMLTKEIGKENDKDKNGDLIKRNDENWWHKYKADWGNRKAMTTVNENKSHKIAESAKTTDEKLKELQKLKSEDYVKYMAARDEVRKEWEEKQRKNYKIKLTARQEYAGVNVKDTTDFNPNTEENKLAIYKKLKK